MNMAEPYDRERGLNKTMRRPTRGHSRESELYPITGTTIIHWRPLALPPEEDCYVLLRFDDPALGEIVMETAAYNRGKFEVRAEGGQWVEIPLARIRGWAYPLFEPIPKTSVPGSEDL